jgi:hypothetical protein
MNGIKGLRTDEEGSSYFLGFISIEGVGKWDDGNQIAKKMYE